MKKCFFDSFQAFYIAFDHVNACASMHTLVEIHNRKVNDTLRKLKTKHTNTVGIQIPDTLTLESSENRYFYVKFSNDHLIGWTIQKLY